MLAQNFMSADALGITEEQHAALVKTLGFFERGEVPAHRFYMGEWCDDPEDECGSIMCIGGWAESLSGKKVFEVSLSWMPGNLRELFFGRGNSDLSPAPGVLVCRDPAKGAHALRNYLTRGDADWAGVMAGG